MLIHNKKWEERCSFPHRKILESDVLWALFKKSLQESNFAINHFYMQYPEQASKLLTSSNEKNLFFRNKFRWTSDFNIFFVGKQAPLPIFQYGLLFPTLFHMTYFSCSYMNMGWILSNVLKVLVSGIYTVVKIISNFVEFILVILSFF